MRAIGDCENLSLQSAPEACSAADRGVEGIRDHDVEKVALTGQGSSIERPSPAWNHAMNYEKPEEVVDEALKYFDGFESSAC